VNNWFSRHADMIVVVFFVILCAAWSSSEKLNMKNSGYNMIDSVNEEMYTVYKIKVLKNFVESLEIPDHSKRKILHTIAWEIELMEFGIKQQLGEEIYKKMNPMEKKE
jgi:hypothetical protein